MDKMQHLGSFCSKHKYFLSIILFGLIGGLLGNNSIYRYFELSSENSALRKEIADYDARIASYRQQRKVLETDPNAVEEIARVRLLMKKANEDIYVVETTSKDSAIQFVTQ